MAARSAQKPITYHGGQVIAGAICLLIGGGCAIGLAHVVMEIPLRLSFDVNEGWNAYHAQAAVSGGLLYPPRESLFINNYPPLSFYLIGWFGAALGDNIIAGRVMSVVATLLCAGLIFLALRRMKAGRSEALFGGLVFLALMLVTSSYVGMDDPQLLGQAIGMIGLVLVLRDGRTVLDVSCAALALSIAFFIKHNLVVLPVACTVWLCVYDRDRGFLLAALGGLLAVSGAVLFRLAYGHDLFAILNNPRAYSFVVALQSTAKWLALPGPFLVALIVLIKRRGGDRYVIFCAGYSLLAMVVGGSMLGGSGVDRNVMFDANIGLSLGAGLVVDRFASRMSFFVLAIPFAVALVIGNHGWLRGDYWSGPRQKEAASSESDIALLRAVKGPAICQTLALCYWAGKAMTIDPFNSGPINAERGDALIRFVDRHAVAVIQVGDLSALPRAAGVRQAILSRFPERRQSRDGMLLFRQPAPQ